MNIKQSFFLIVPALLLFIFFAYALSKGRQSNKGIKQEYIPHYRTVELVSSGMLPSYPPKNTYRFDTEYYKHNVPVRGDVVIYSFLDDFNVEREYVQRIIGLPGERVKVSNGTVYIDGNQLAEPYAADSANTPLWEGGYIHSDTDYVIPPNTYFVLGDNRGRSRDSREVGFIPFSKITGKLVE